MTKHQGEQLVPAGKVLDVLVAIILFHNAKEDKLIQEFDHLSENVRTCVHIGSIFRKVKFKSLRPQKPCNFLTYNIFKELF